MRTVFSAMVAGGIMLLLAGQVQAQTQGKTEIKIGSPQFQPIPLMPTMYMATVPVSLELDSTTTMFASLSVTVTDTRPIWGGPITPSFTLAAPPQPGKGPVTINVLFTAKKGVTYKMEAIMRYMDAAMIISTTNHVQNITPP